jgi:hypothetical protein
MFDSSVTSETLAEGSQLVAKSGETAFRQANPGTNYNNHLDQGYLLLSITPTVLKVEVTLASKVKTTNDVFRVGQTFLQQAGSNRITSQF